MRWDQGAASPDLCVLNGVRISKGSDAAGDYGAVLGTIKVSGGRHAWSVLVSYVSDSNTFIVGGGLGTGRQRARHDCSGGGGVSVVVRRRARSGARSRHGRSHAAD